MGFMLLVLAIVGALGLGVLGFLVAMGQSRRLSQLEDEVKTLVALLEAGRGGAAADEPPQPKPAPEAPKAAHIRLPRAVKAPPPPSEADEPAGTVPPDGPATPPPPDAELPVPPPPPRLSLEERFGTRWLVWTGGLALALGALLFVGYAIERGMLGPKVRIVLGIVLGLALAGVGEWLRRRERQSEISVLPSAHIPSVLTAAGTIALFGSLYAAHALFGFIGPTLAFLLLGLVAMGTMLLAALHGPALAGLGLVGSLVTPLLISSSSRSAWPVVLYLAFVALSAYGLARLRRWLWLAVTVVVGVVVWGLAFDATAFGTMGLRDLAPLAHVAIQLALAAVFIAVEPHLGRPDEDARLDRVAAGVLAALVLLAVLTLSVSPHGSGWMLLAGVMVAVLVGTSVVSAPAASAATLAAVLVAGVLLAWPMDRAIPSYATGLMPLVALALRIPDSLQLYLVHGGLLMAGVAVVSAWRLGQGLLLPTRTAAAYAVAAATGPVIALAIAYLRITQFDHSLRFAVLGTVLSLVMAFAASRFRTAEAAAPTPAIRLGTGAFAAAAIAAFAFALVCALSRGYLTVALALSAAGTAFVASRQDIPALRGAVMALGVVVLGRLAWDPRIMGGDVGTTPILNWLLIGYGVPTLAFAYAAAELRKVRDDDALKITDALTVLFAALLVVFQIRHLVTGGDPLRAGTDHFEQGLLAITAILFAYVLARLDSARANVVFRLGSLVAGLIAAALIAFGLGIGHNPALTNEPIYGRGLASSLFVAYLLPAVGLAWLASRVREVRPAWYVNGANALALCLLFAYVSLEIRHLFQGARIGVGRHTSEAEQWAYSAGWLAIGVGLLAAGVMRQSREMRLASALIVVLTVLKVFLIDLSVLQGLWRAVSFLALGGVLLALALVYQRLVFRDGARAASAPPPADSAGAS
ncbi:MAG: DUF2339 domain-containing protein [Hyphomicrobiaceae bacterium]